MPATLGEKYVYARGRGASGIAGYKRMEARFGVYVLRSKKTSASDCAEEQIVGWGCRSHGLVEEGG